MRCFHIEVNPAIVIHLKTNGLRLSQRHSCSELSVSGELSTDSSLHYTKKYPLYHRIWCLFFPRIFKVCGFSPKMVFLIGLRISTLHAWMRIFHLPHQPWDSVPLPTLHRRVLLLQHHDPWAHFSAIKRGCLHSSQQKPLRKNSECFRKLHLLLQLLFLPLQLCLCTIQL